MALLPTDRGLALRVYIFFSLARGCDSLGLA